jgi:large subunit ribosomal protein L22
MAQSGTKIAAVRETRKGATIHKTNERPGTRAQVRYVRVSAYKAREVLDLIRGKHVADADEILQFVERDIAIIIRKALASAVANAANNDGQDPETLFVSACYADEGPTLKRWRPRARGRATRIRKRTCHITIIVSRLGANELRIRAERDARSGRVAGGTAGRASRRSRVAKSRQAEGHTHDHDHDHDDEVLDTDVEIEVDEVEAGEVEASETEAVADEATEDAADIDATNDVADEPEAAADEAGPADAETDEKDND